jgi:hypothetical protein
MELMLCYPRFTLDFQGSRVMAYRNNKTFSPWEFGAALDSPPALSGQDWNSPLGTPLPSMMLVSVPDGSSLPLW